MHKSIDTTDNASASERRQRQNLMQLFRGCPIPENELLPNLGLFIKRQDFSSLLFLNELYTKILDIHGIIFDLGTRWGRNLATFASLRGIYEPFNHNRKLVGFDTFEGLLNISAKDGYGKNDLMKTGSMAVTAAYETYLSDLLRYHESESPIAHIEKFEVIKGDACKEVPAYLERNQHTLIALAYFDFGVYQPTFDGLKAIMSRLVKGSIVGFDQLNAEHAPGETLAFLEVFGDRQPKVYKSPFSPTQSYIIIE